MQELTIQFNFNLLINNACLTQIDHQYKNDINRYYARSSKAIVAQQKMNIISHGIAEIRYTTLELKRNCWAIKSANSIPFLQPHINCTPRWMHFMERSDLGGKGSKDMPQQLLNG